MNNSEQNSNNEVAIYQYIEKQIRNKEFKSKEHLNEYLINLRNNGNLTNISKISELLKLYDDLKNKSIQNIRQFKGNEQIIYLDIEKKIKNNEFRTKEDLIKYLMELKKNNEINIDNEKIQELLILYDSLNITDEKPLNMENYKEVNLEDQDLIVSTKKDQVLKNLNDDNINKEFKNVQNEIIANSEDGVVNADEIFGHMAEYQKEEVSLIAISELHKVKDINIEILQKIKFFVSNKYINPYDYSVDVNNGVFYNKETAEILEVRKNESTNQFEIYRGGELVYGNDYQNEKEYENKNKPKVRTLRPPVSPNNNAAFSEIGFLVFSIATFIALLSMVIFLIK